MKKLLKLTALVAMTLTIFGCDKEKPKAEQFLDVTAHNIAGVWEAETWSGNTLEEGTYVYIEFERRNQTFKIYENLDTFSAHLTTGRYNISISERYGAAVIRGEYDYTLGQEWNHRYIISDLTKTSMKWIATDDPENIVIYKRCDAVPQEVLDELPATE